MTPSKTQPYRASAQEIDTLARTLWGEARGEGILGMAAVAAVIMNRVRADLGHDNKPDWWGEGILGVCRKPYQFSCWNDNDPNRVKLRSVNNADPLFVQAITIAHLAAAGWLADPTVGSTHYHAITIHPNWAEGKTPNVTLGRHVFYSGV
jgi:N-acetylmuramoyl-L-alanine amidase